jgi:hypothetical protein
MIDPQSAGVDIALLFFTLRPMRASGHFTGIMSHTTAAELLHQFKHERHHRDYAEALYDCAEAPIEYKSQDPPV